MVRPGAEKNQNDMSITASKRQLRRKRGNTGRTRIEHNTTRKAPGALDPAVVLPPPPGGCKICYGHSR